VVIELLGTIQNPARRSGLSHWNIYSEELWWQEYPYTKNCINCDEVFVIKSAQYKTKKYCTYDCSV